MTKTNTYVFPGKPNYIDLSIPPFAAYKNQLTKIRKVYFCSIVKDDVFFYTKIVQTMTTNAKNTMANAAVEKEVHYENKFR